MRRSLRRPRKKSRRGRGLSGRLRAEAVRRSSGLIAGTLTHMVAPGIRRYRSANRRSTSSVGGRRAQFAGSGNDAARRVRSSAQGSTISTPMLWNSLAFRVTTPSPRVAAAAARKASGTWSSSAAPPPSLVFHDPRARAGVGLCPVCVWMSKKLPSDGLGLHQGAHTPPWLYRQGNRLR